MKKSLNQSKEEAKNETLLIDSTLIYYNHYLFHHNKQVTDRFAEPRSTQSGKEKAILSSIE